MVRCEMQSDCRPQGSTHDMQFFSGQPHMRQQGLEIVRMDMPVTRIVRLAQRT